VVTYGLMVKGKER